MLHNDCTVTQLATEEIHYSKVGGSEINDMEFRSMLRTINRKIRKLITEFPELKSMEHKFYLFLTAIVDDEESVQDITTNFDSAW